MYVGVMYVYVMHENELRQIAQFEGRFLWNSYK
jgi:hypothetical protein